MTRASYARRRRVKRPAEDQRRLEQIVRDTTQAFQFKVQPVARAVCDALDSRRSRGR